VAYTQQTWADNAAGGTPVSAARLTHIEQGIGAVDTALTTAPSIDELFTSTALGDVGTNWYQIFIAPFPLRVAQVSFMTQVTVPDSATNNYVFSLRRMRAGTGTSFASKTTNSADGAGGQGISAYTDWNFDNIAFNGTVAQLAKGDALLLAVAVNAGTPTPAVLTRSTVTARYVPL
jgi:hypothetical protein